MYTACCLFGQLLSSNSFFVAVFPSNRKFMSYEIEQTRTWTPMSVIFDSPKNDRKNTGFDRFR